MLTIHKLLYSTAIRILYTYPNAVAHSYQESGSSHPPIVSANNVASASLTGRNKELSDKETSDISIVAAEPLSEPKKHLNFSSILKVSYFYLCLDLNYMSTLKYLRLNISQHDKYF